MVTPTGRVSPFVDRTGAVTGARFERGRPLWPWERASNERELARMHARREAAAAEENQRMQALVEEFLERYG